MENLQKFSSNFQELIKSGCSPSKIAFVLSLITLIINLHYENLLSILKNVIAYILLIYILDYLCKENMENFSWLLLSLPIYIVMTSINQYTLSYTKKEDN